MRIIDIALKDLRQLLRDRKAAIFLLIMPILFTVMFGFAFSGGGEEDPRLPVGLLDQDGGRAATALTALVDASPGVRVVEMEPADQEGAEEQVAKEELAAALVIPMGFGQRLWESGGAPASVIADPGSIAGSVAVGEIRSAVARLAGAAKAAELALGLRQDADALSPAERDQFLLEGLDLAVTSWQAPPLTVGVTEWGAAPADDQTELYGPNSFSHPSAGMMVQFAMAGLMGAAQILVLERKSGALARLLTTATSRGQVIMGHYVAMFIMILCQLLLLAGFGQLVLGVDYAREPAASLLIVISLSLWAAGLGLLIGALARREGQVEVFALIPMMVLSGLGGAWIPLEITPEGFQAIGHLTPTAWAMDGLKNVIIRGLGFESVLVPSAVLLGYAVLTLGLAIWRFRTE